MKTNKTGTVSIKTFEPMPTPADVAAKLRPGLKVKWTSGHWRRNGANDWHPYDGTGEIASGPHFGSVYVSYVSESGKTVTACFTLAWTCFEIIETESQNRIEEIKRKLKAWTVAEIRAEHCGRRFMPAADFVAAWIDRNAGRFTAVNGFGQLALIQTATVANLVKEMAGEALMDGRRNPQAAAFLYCVRKLHRSRNV